MLYDSDASVRESIVSKYAKCKLEPSKLAIAVVRASKNATEHDLVSSAMETTLTANIWVVHYQGTLSLHIERLPGNTSQAG